MTTNGNLQQISGSVKWFDTDKGYGFLTAEGVEKDVFLHIKQLRQSGITNGLIDGERVVFVCNTGPKGLFATNVARAK